MKEKIMEVHFCNENRDGYETDNDSIYIMMPDKEYDSLEYISGVDDKKVKCDNLWFKMLKRKYKYYYFADVDVEDIDFEIVPHNEHGYADKDLYAWLIDPYNITEFERYGNKKLSKLG